VSSPLQLDAGGVVRLALSTFDGLIWRWRGHVSSSPAG
jgi:hypothetical protein